MEKTSWLPFFHQSVMTPNGPGIVQGITGEGFFLISHHPEDMPATQRPERKCLWVLKYYPFDQLKPVKEK